MLKGGWEKKNDIYNQEGASTKIGWAQRNSFFKSDWTWKG